MSEEKMMNWNGEGYKALVTIGRWEETDASNVCMAIGMTQPGDVATESEIEEARKLLKPVILGMAYWLKNRSEAFERELTDDTLRPKLNKLRGDFTTQTGGGVTVPVAKSGQDYSQLKVRIVEFSAVNVEGQHPAPDPLLLAVRAAATWSWRHGQQLKADAEPQEEEEDELSILAEEQFLERRKNFGRPKTWDDLARGLGQPFGYQPEGETNM
jgi:hypothetical protein